MTDNKSVENISSVENMSSIDSAIENNSEVDKMENSRISDKEIQTNSNTDNSNIINYYGYCGTFRKPETVVDYTKFPDIFDSDNTISNDVVLYFFPNTFLINLINCPKVTVLGVFRKRREQNENEQFVDLGYLVKIDTCHEFLFLSSLLQNCTLLNLSRMNRQMNLLNSFTNVIICNHYRLITINPDILISYLNVEKDIVKQKYNKEMDYLNTFIYEMKNIKQEISSNNSASSSIASSSSAISSIDMPKGLVTDGLFQVKVGDRKIEVNKFRFSTTNTFLKYYAKYIEYINKNNTNKNKNTNMNTNITLRPGIISRNIISEPPTLINNQRPINFNIVRQSPNNSFITKNTTLFNNKEKKK